MSELDDEKIVRKKESKERLYRRSELEDIMWILSTVQGRRFFWRVLERCGIFRSSFTGNNTTFFNEGERNIGLMLMSDMNDSDPTAYLKMIQESKQSKIQEVL